MSHKKETSIVEYTHEGDLSYNGQNTKSQKVIVWRCKKAGNFKG